jgi:hypothetical protein
MPMMRAAFRMLPVSASAWRNRSFFYLFRVCHFPAGRRLLLRLSVGHLVRLGQLHGGGLLLPVFGRAAPAETKPCRYSRACVKSPSSDLRGERTERPSTAPGLQAAREANVGYAIDAVDPVQLVGEAELREYIS